MQQVDPRSAQGTVQYRTRSRRAASFQPIRGFGKPYPRVIRRGSDPCTRAL